MANLEEIVVELVAETSKLRAELASATKVTEDSAKKMQDAIEGFTKESAKNTSFFQTSMATMVGFLGSQAVLGAVHAVADVFKEMIGEISNGVDAANREEDAMKKLSTALALSGKYSQDSAEGLREFAGEMEKTTGIADDAVISNLGLLSSLTKLDAEGLKKAQKSAIDMSAALGIDLDTATRLVGKGIEGNTDAFKRYGLTIEKGSNETENFANVTNALNQRFGDAAKGNLQTFSGGILNLKNSMENAFEAIGRVITNNEALKSVIGSVAKVFADLEAYVTDNADALSEGLSTAIEYVITGMSVLVQILKVGYEAFKAIYDVVSLAVEALADLYLAEYRLANLDFSGAIDAFDGLGKSAQKVADDVTGNTAPAFDAIQNKLYEVGKAAIEAGDNQEEGFQKATAAVKNQKQVIDELVTKFYNLREARQQATDDYVKGLLDESAALDASFKNQETSTQNAYDLKLIDFQNYQATRMQLLQDQNQVESDALLEKYANDDLTETQFQAAQLQQIQDQNAKQIALKKDLKKQEDDLNSQKLQGYSSFFGNLATLQQSSSKELAAIGKAAAVAQATIDGYAAIQGAYKQGSIIGGPPLGAAFAAAAGIATAANLAKITGAGLKNGIDSVPGVGSQDNFPAILAPGERVVPAKSNEDLTAFLKNQQEGGGVTINMNFNGIGAITREQAAEIMSALNDAIASNTGLRILGT